MPDFLDNAIDQYLSKAPPSVVDDAIDEYLSNKADDPATAEYYRSLGPGAAPSLPNLPKPKLPEVSTASKVAGAVAAAPGQIRDYSAEGAREAIAGGKQMVAPGVPFKERVGGFNRAFSGTMQAASPALLPLAAAATVVAPQVMIPGMAATITAQKGTEYGLKAAGVDPEYAELGGNVASFIPGVGTAGKLASKVTKRIPWLMKAEGSVAQKEAAPAVEDAITKAVEEVVAKPPPIPRMNRQQRREAVKPPKTGIPEAEQRLLGAKEDIAQTKLGKGYEETTPEVQRVIDAKAAETPNPSTLAVPEPLTNPRQRQRLPWERMQPKVGNPEAGYANLGAVFPVDLKQAEATRRAAAVAANKTIKALTDRYVEAHRLDQMAKGDLPVEESVGKGFQMASSLARGKAQDDLIDLGRLLRGLPDTVVSSGPTNAMNPLAHQRFSDKSMLQSAIEYMKNERHLEKFADPDLAKTYVAEGGKTSAEIAAEMAAMRTALGPDKMKLIGDFSDKLRDFSLDHVVKPLVDAGVISGEHAANMTAKNQKYIPFRRLEHTLDAMDEVPHGSGVTAEFIHKKMLGSEKEIADPVQSIVDMVYKARTAAENNIARRKVAAFADRPEFAGVVEHVKPNAKPPKGNEFGILHYMKDGVKQAVEVPKGIEAAAKNLDAEQADIVSRAMAFWKNTLQTGVTLGLEFTGRNVIRDYMTATMASGLKGQGFTPYDWAHGFLSAVSRDIPQESLVGKSADALWGKMPKAMGPNPIGERQYRSFLRSGGAFSGPYSDATLAQTADKLRRGPVDEAINRLATPKKWLPHTLDAMRYVGETAELTPRLGEFSGQMRQGATEAEAAWASRNVTADFQKYGTAMGVIRHWTPFLSARVSGWTNLNRAFRENPLRTSLRAGTMIGIPYLMTYYHNTTQFPEIYDSIPDREKETMIPIIWGDEKDKDGNATQVFRFPIGDIAPITGILQVGLDQWRGKNPESYVKAAFKALNAYSPVQFARDGHFSATAIASSGLPPPIKALEEVRTGKNMFTGQDLVPAEYRDKGTPSNQYGPDTSAVAVKASKALEKIGMPIAPPVLEHVAGNTLTGYLGRYATTVSPSAMEPTKFRTGKFSEGVKKGFVGVRGNQTNVKNFEDARAVKVADEDVSNVVHRNVDYMLKTLEEFKPPEGSDAKAILVRSAWERIQKEVPYEMQPRALTMFVTDFENSFTKKNSPFSSSERYIQRLPNRIKADFVTQRVKSAPEDKKYEVLEDLKNKKILTEAVINLILESAAGVRQ